MALPEFAALVRGRVRERELIESWLRPGGRHAAGAFRLPSVLVLSGARLSGEDVLAHALARHFDPLHRREKGNGKEEVQGILRLESATGPDECLGASSWLRRSPALAPLAISASSDHLAS